MVNFQCKERYALEDLRQIIALLRSENGCPWDKVQTHQSIRRNLLEEAYEACEAIDLDDTALLQEELGDVLTQVLFHAQIKQEEHQFTIDDVADFTCKKLIFRHPHIFADDKADNPDDVMQKWDELKRQEKQLETTTQALSAVARSLPATWRAEKIQAKARKVGFDWPDVSGAIAKLEEELAELKSAIASGTGIHEEIGDLLFSAVNVSRLLGADPEDVLHQSADKFIQRFSYLESAALNRGQALESLTLDEMEALYQAGKIATKQC